MFKDYIHANMTAIDAINEWYKQHRYGNPAIIYYESGQRGPTKHALAQAFYRLHTGGRLECITRGIYMRTGKMEIRVV